jgi:hypothetical protein
MNDRTYRKFLRFNLRQRGDMLKVRPATTQQVSIHRHLQYIVFTLTQGPVHLCNLCNLLPVNCCILVGPQAEEKARAQRGAERAAAVKAFRSEMSDRSSAAQEARRAAVNTSAQWLLCRLA